MNLKDYIILALVGFFLFNTFFTNDIKHENTTTHDTIYRNIHIPAVHDTIFFTKTKTRVITEFSIPDSIKDSIDILNAYIESMKIREYEEKYEDSIISAKLSSKVQGKLLESSLEYVLKTRNIKSIEIHSETKLKPKYAVLLGGGVSVGAASFPVLTFGGGLVNKKGRIITLELCSNKSVRLGYFRPVFTKW